MFFDVTYTDPARVPRLLAHAITLASPTGGPGTPALTDPVPVGCRPLAVLHPPLVGHGWTAFGGCCTVVAHHRGSILPVNGASQAGQQFAIDYEQIGPDGTCAAADPPRPWAPGGATTPRSWPRSPAWSSTWWTACRTSSRWGRSRP
jgi:hypothetical protein